MLDPHAKQLLDFVASRNLPSFHTLSPVEARAFYKDRRSATQPEPQAVAAVEEFAVPGPAGNVPIRSYRPQGASPDAALPALVYYHGGGHTIGDLDTHDTLCRELCNRSGFAVFSVDYRLGPEHKFPVAVQDCFAALQWIASHAGKLSINSGKLAVGGDSAGGNLAAVMSLMARDQGGPGIVFQLLIYPATDLRFLSRSHKTNGRGYLLTTEVIEYFTVNYLSKEADRLDWHASPALALDHRGLPPTLVITAGYDPLCDEGKEYADLLRAAGNQVEYIDYPGQIHGFITMGKVIAQANEAVALCANRLKAI
ncbi:MAG: acetyl hydrolase [Burkholderiales bacterium RIFCSPLOWO2_02_FULL_57_36]|nr:MAG: acetyl hydrolase [Burkholderiales bacterium RIFCSPLOWO2_02_FULL_57_36]